MALISNMLFQKYIRCTNLGLEKQNPLAYVEKNEAEILLWESILETWMQTDSFCGALLPTLQPLGAFKDLKDLNVDLSQGTIRER